jgi:hypothetical protein
VPTYPSANSHDATTHYHPGPTRPTGQMVVDPPGDSHSAVFGECLFLEYFPHAFGAGTGHQCHRKPPTLHRRIGLLCRFDADCRFLYSPFRPPGRHDHWRCHCRDGLPARQYGQPHQHAGIDLRGTGGGLALALPMGCRWRSSHGGSRIKRAWRWDQLWSDLGFHRW